MEEYFSDIYNAENIRRCDDYACDTFENNNRVFFLFTFIGPTRGRAVLLSTLVDERCRVPVSPRSRSRPDMEPLERPHTQGEHSPLQAQVPQADA